MKKNCPTAEEISDLMKQMEMRENIREHSVLVKNVCSVICDNLKKPDNISRELVEISALLHDITKTRSLDTGESHAQTGAELMESMGYHEIAGIISDHVFLESIDENSALTESEIVHYADKRVKHSTIVSLDDRIADIAERYGTTPERKKTILARTGFLRKLEKKIQENLVRDIDPDLYRMNER